MGKHFNSPDPITSVIRVVRLEVVMRSFEPVYELNAEDANFLAGLDVPATPIASAAVAGPPPMPAGPPHVLSTDRVRVPVPRAAGKRKASKIVRW